MTNLQPWLKKKKVIFKELHHTAYHTDLQTHTGMKHPQSMLFKEYVYF